MAGSTPDGTTSRYEVAIVAYHSAPLVAKLLDGLDAGVPVVIVDNAQGADGLDEIAAARPGCRYQHGPGRGFGAGVNVATRACTADVMVLINPDCFPTTPQIEELVDTLEADPRLVQVAMNSVLADGRSDLGVGGWEPSLRRAVVHAVGAHLVFPHAGLWARPRPGENIELDWLGGACMALRRRTLLELGGLDESFFVYNEDVDLGRKIRAAGLGLHLRSDLLVEHGQAGSGESKPRMVQLRGDSMMRYLRRHHARLEVEGIRLALSAGTLARWVLARIRSDAMRISDAEAYLRGLWRGRPAGM